MPLNLDEVIDRTQTDSIKWNPKILERWFKLADQLPLWVADMDFPCPQAVTEAIINRAQHGIFGYGAAPDTYFQAVIDWFKEVHAWKIQREWFLVTPGIVPAINFIVQRFSKPGDQVVIQEPVYYPFKEAIVNNGRQVIINRLIRKNGGYSMDFGDLEKKCRHARAKIMILCSPHNPVGRVWNREELTQLGDICIQNEILVVSDEIHCDLVYPGHKHIPFASLGQKYADHSITCTAASKTFNLAGLQISNILVPNPTLRAEFKLSLENLGLMGANIFGYTAVEAAYRHGKTWLDQVLAYISANYAFLLEYCEEYLPYVRMYPLEGTYLAWIDFSDSNIPPQELDRIIKQEAHVLLDDGAMFGVSGQGFQRINLACPRKTLMAALDKIRSAISPYLNKADGESPEYIYSS